jgi:hypothetical protein
MHFNKAQAFRYRSEMSPAQQQRCQDEFGEYLEEMGYSLTC